MIKTTDRDFYVRRESTQRQLAAQAADPRIVAIHELLADEYARRTAQAPQPSSASAF